MKLFFELFTNELIEKLLSFSFPISLYIYQDLKRFAAHRIVFILTFRCAKQFYVPNMQEQSKAGKKSEINRQTFVI